MRTVQEYQLPHEIKLIIRGEGNTHIPRFSFYTNIGIVVSQLKFQRKEELERYQSLFVGY